jgi:hypothetical protein
VIGASQRGRHKLKEDQPGIPLVRERWYWRILWVFLVPLLLFLALAFVFSVTTPAPNWLPFNLHSVLSADYSSDLHGKRMPELKIQLIEEVMIDNGVPTIPGQFATLQAGLLTPVPTVTPAAPSEGGLPPGNDPQPTATLPGSGEKDNPTPTPSATATELPSSTPSPTSLPSPTATATPTPIATWLPPVLPSPTKPRPTNPLPTQPPPTQIPPTATQPPPPPTQPPPTKPPKPYPGPQPTLKPTPYP